MGGTGDEYRSRDRGKGGKISMDESASKIR